jgi:hypothetical protein
MAVDKNNSNSTENDNSETSQPITETETNLKTETTNPASAKKPTTKRKKKTSTKRKNTNKKSNKSVTVKSSKLPQKVRGMRSFPASTFEDALPLAQAIQQFAAGQRVRRLTLFDNLQRSPDSGISRQLMTNSSRYGLTTGSKNTEYIELTSDGKTATNPEIDERQKLKARFKLAIENIPPFNDLYDHLNGNKVPAQAVLRDFLLEKGYSPDEVAECIDTFIVNAKFLGLLKPIAGSERLLSIEHVLDEVSKKNHLPFISEAQIKNDSSTLSDTLFPSESDDDWSTICFYITPIGSVGSEQRQHSDLFLSQIIEPALEEFGLKVVRADQIGQPGLITSQIIEHIIKSRLAIADLSFHNANVFYELSLRHAFKLPTVQIIRSSDSIPFDVNQVRTIQIDNSSIYSLLPQLESYKSEIANQVRRALESPDGIGNPLTMFYPNLTVLQSSE